MALALTGLLMVQAAPRLSGNSPAGVVSDEFDGGALSPTWTFVNPLGDGSVIVGGGTASITAPSGADHNLWSSGVDAPRIMQPVSNGDFEVEVKFNSAVTQKYQMQGILAKQGGSTYLRFENYSNGKKVYAFVALVDPVAGTASTIHSQVVSAAATSYLRLVRVGDSWTFERSVDGTAWQSLTTFTQAFTLSEIGVYAGNLGAASHTSIVDYFRDVTPAPPSEITALDDAYDIDEDLILNVALPGVLSNDTDPEGDTLTAALVTSPVNGAVALNADGSFDYTPDPNFNGVDTFTYEASDGTSPPASATVTITVNPVPDAPTATPQSVVGIQDTPLPITLTGQDDDGDALTFAIVDQPLNGALSGTLPNVTYTPGSSYVVTDSFTFTASDATATSAPATVDITVVSTNQGLLAHWSFDAGTAVDDSGGGNDGVVSGALPAGGLISLSAFDFDGADDYIDLGTMEVTPVASPTDGVTVTAWVRPDLLANCTTGDCHIFSKTSGPLDQDHVLTLSTVDVAGELRLRLQLKANGVTDTLTASSGALQQGQWVHVAATYDGAGMTLFLDGRDVGSAPKTGTVATDATAQTWIGSRPPTPTDSPWDGAIDEVRLYSRGLEPYEVRKMVATGVGIVSDEFDGTSLAPYWTYVNPAGDGTLTFNGTAASIAMAAGTSHNVWSTGIDAPRLMQPVTDGDFEVEVKFDSSLTSRFQTQGALVKQDQDNYIKFEYRHDGTTVVFMVARIDTAAATAVVIHDDSLPSSPAEHLKVGRADNTWTVQRSSDGSNWQVITVFDEAFVSTELGFYAGNLQGPAHTGIVDYFRDVTPFITTAQPDTFAVDEDVVLDVAAPGVLGNDTDPEGDPMTALLETGPTNGALTLNADGSFTYTPDPNFNGSDAFTYRATDGTTTSLVANVSIGVASVADVPVADDQFAFVEVDSNLAVTLTGSDGDGDPLDFAVTTGPVNGVLSGQAPDLTYTPDPGYLGPDSFEFTASDAAFSSDVATVSLFVHVLNSPPVVVNDAYSVDEDLVLNVASAGVLGNDSDPDGDPMTAELVTEPVNGTVVLNGDGSFTYTPDPEFSGADSFTYQASDQYETSTTATVSITVDAVNDAPAAFGQTRSTSPDAPVAIVLAAVDVEGDPITFSAATQPANGIVTGTAPNVVYTPNAGYLGPDSFTFTASDAISTGDPAVVQITMNATGVDSDEFDSTTLSSFWTFDDPAGDSTLTLDGSTASISVPVDTNHNLWDDDVNAPRLMQSVADGDFEVEARFDSSLTEKYQLQGILAEQSNGTFLRFGNYTNGSSVFAFVAVIDPVAGTASAIHSQSIAAAATSYLRVGRLGDTWTFERSTNGTTWLTLTTFNQAFALSKLGVYAGNVNGPAHTAVVDYFRDVQPTIPIASDDAYSTDEDTVLNVAAPGVLGNDVDAGGDPLTAILETGPSNGALTLNSDGSFSFDPDTNFNGSDSFTYLASDGVDSSSAATVSITIDPVNDVPVANAGLLIVEQDSSGGVTLTATDPDSEPLTYDFTDPAHGTLSGTAPDLIYTPTAGYFGPDAFTFTVSDAVSTSNEATVSITVFELNDAPLALDDAYGVDEDNVLNVPAVGVLANDSDPESDPIVAELVTAPSNGSVTLNADGSFTYTPAPDFSGVDSFTYQARDLYEPSAPATVTITVNAINDPPVGNPQSVDTDIDEALAIVLDVFDADNDPLSFQITAEPTNGVLTGTAPNLTYTPDAGYLGPDSFSYIASDATTNTGTVVVQIEVKDPSDGIITFFYGDDQKFNNVGRPQIFADVLGNAFDPDGIGSLTYSLNGGPEQTVSVGPDGRRLANAGDFNLQLSFDDLVVGANLIVVTATDTTGDAVQSSMTVNYPGRNFWPTTYSIDWDTVTDIQDAVQVVDGEWSVVPNGVTTDDIGYDRLLAIGDMTWNDFTATVPITVHDYDPTGNWCCGVGIVLRWEGHTNNPVTCVQPICGWKPYGNEAWYVWDAAGGHSSNFSGNGDSLKDNSGLVLQLGVTYMFKVEVETIGTDNWYRKKVWVQGQNEPAGWLVEKIRNTETISAGSLLLIAHHTDVTFGDIVITPVN